MENLDKYSEKGIELLLSYAPKLILALITLIVGLWIIKHFIKILGKTFKEKKLDESLSPFLLSLIGVVFRILLIISVASMIGIQMASFIAILAAAGLAIGLALSGTLQ
ncbi:MAG: mechanosensitive ion channel family protein, partial [Bacteroidetes bacterium]|nr:mechanosensitive ion channel family protein [Bacteroidota bacterium]